MLNQAISLPLDVICMEILADLQSFCMDYLSYFKKFKEGPKPTVKIGKKVNTPQAKNLVPGKIPVILMPPVLIPVILGPAKNDD